MGDTNVFNSASDIVSDKWNGDKVTRKSLAASGCGSMGRRGLADITNLQQKTLLSNGDDKSRAVPLSTLTKDHIDQLIKENQALMKQIADRNKIIELSGIEIQKLRINLHKAQQQNWQIAQANSHMLAELNAGKDRLKLLQHEIGCVKATLAAKNLELKGKEPQVKCQPAQNDTYEIQTTKPEEGVESSQAEKNDRKRSGSQRRRQSKAHASKVNDTLVKEKAENKRLCVRRQSARLKSEESNPSEDSFEIEKDKFPVRSEPIIDLKAEEEVVVPSNSLNDNKDVRGERSAVTGPEETRRTSLGRPMRRAAEKVPTYKEIPLNVKMRRPI